MPFSYYKNLNPAVKVLALGVLLVGLLVVRSLQLNVMFLIISMLLIYSSIPECRKPFLLFGVLLLAFLVGYGMYRYFHMTGEFYIGEYNYANIYFPLRMSSYLGILYLHFNGIANSVELLSLCNSLNQTLHLSKGLTHRLYRILLFMKQYKGESSVVQRVYKAKGMIVSRNSWKVCKIVLKNFKRKCAEEDLALQAKGFDTMTPSSNYATYTLNVGDALYLVWIVLSMAISYYYKIW